MAAAAREEVATGRPDGEAGPSSPPPGLAAGLVVLLALAAYANTFAVPFQFDDGRSIVLNPSVRNLGAFFASSPAQPRAVANFTFAVNNSLGGSPWGFHAVNLAIHVAAALLVYALTAFACRAAAPPGSPLARRAPLAAAVAAAFFVAHPIQTQAVTYVVQRMASLAALLYLGAVLAYARSAVEPRAARKALLLAASFALAALAVFTKENAVTIPASLALVEACLLEGPMRRRAARLAPFVALAAAALPVLGPGTSIRTTTTAFAGMRSADAGVASGSPPAWLSYAATQPAVILRYLRLLLVPAGQNVEHDVPIQASPLAPAVLVGGALLVALLAVPAAAAWRARRRSPLARIVLFAVGWFVVTLSVESSVIPLTEVMIEHRMYLPSAGLFVALGCAVAWAVDRLGLRARRILLAGVAGWVLLLAGATYARNRVWRDPVTLWTDAAQKSPGRSRPWVFLGQAAMERGDLEAARGLFEKAIAARPGPHSAFLNLGLVEARLGHLAEAESALREGLARGGEEMEDAHLALALLLLGEGRTEEACDEFRAEVRVHRGNPRARASLVACRLARGDLAGAVEEGERLAAEQPGNAQGVYNLALAHDALGDAARAADCYRSFLATAGPELEQQRSSAREWLAAHAGGAPPGPTR